MNNFEQWVYNNCEFEFEAEPEHISPEDLYCEQADIDWVYEQLSNGNDAAWFCAKVTAKMDGKEGTDYLGGCSYRSFKDFLEEDGYYGDMKVAAAQSLAREIMAGN